MLLVANLNPTLLPDEFASWWCSCGVTWDAVPKQLWLLNLWLNPGIV